MRFALGCVMVWGRECVKIDKAFSDLLPSSVNEVHTVDWSNNALQNLLGQLAQTDVLASLIVLTKTIELAGASRPRKVTKKTDFAACVFS